MAGKTPKLDRVAPAPVGPGAAAAIAGIGNLGRGISAIGSGLQDLKDRRDAAKRGLLVGRKTIEMNTALNEAKGVFLQTPYEDDEAVAFSAAASDIFAEIAGDEGDATTKFVLQKLALDKSAEASSWGERTSFGRLTQSKIDTQKFVVDHGVQDYGAIGEPGEAEDKLRETHSFIWNSDTMLESAKPAAVEDATKRSHIARADWLLDNNPEGLLLAMADPDQLPMIQSAERVSYENKARKNILNNQVLHDESLRSDWLDRLGSGEASSPGQIEEVIQDIHGSGASSGTKLTWLRIARDEKFGPDPGRTRPMLKADIYKQILAQSPSNPFSPVMLDQHIHNGLSLGDATELINFYRLLSGTGQLNKTDSATWRKALDVGFNIISKSNMFMRDPDSDAIAMAWLINSQNKMQEYINSGKDPMQLLSDKNDDYIIKRALDSAPTLQERAAFIGVQMEREGSEEIGTDPVGRIEKDRATRENAKPPKPGSVSDFMDTIK